MKTSRLALLLTFTPGEELPAGEAKVRELKRLLWKAAHSKSCKDFVDDIVIWQTLSVNHDEDGDKQELIDKVDRHLIHQIGVDQAKVILTSPQTLQAMLMTFSQLSSAEIPGVLNQLETDKTH